MWRVTGVCGYCCGDFTGLCAQVSKLVADDVAVNDGDPCGGVAGWTIMPDGATGMVCC